MSAHDRDYMRERDRERAMDVKPDPKPEPAPQVVGAVEFPPVRLTPAAAERVAKAGARAHCEVAYGAPVSDEDFNAAWPADPENKRRWMPAAAAMGEALIAEMRLMGWRIEAPTSPHGGERVSGLKGGV